MDDVSAGAEGGDEGTGASGPDAAAELPADPSVGALEEGLSLFGLDLVAKRAEAEERRVELVSRREAIDAELFGLESEIAEIDSAIVQRRESFTVEGLADLAQRLHGELRRRVALDEERELELAALRRRVAGLPPVESEEAGDAEEDEVDGVNTRYDSHKLFVEGYLKGFESFAPGEPMSLAGLRSYRKDGFKAGFEDAAAGIPARSEELAKPYARGVAAKIRARHERERSGRQGEGAEGGAGAGAGPSEGDGDAGGPGLSSLPPSEIQVHDALEGDGGRGEAFV